jgi:hypothetical protein
MTVVDSTLSTTRRVGEQGIRASKSQFMPAKGLKEDFGSIDTTRSMLVPAAVAPEERKPWEKRCSCLAPAHEPAATRPSA